MPRRKISEYRAKTILSGALEQTYDGVSIDTSHEGWRRHVDDLPKTVKYVVKVDQGIKGRFKKGLVKLDRSPQEIKNDIAEFMTQGYRYALIEPYKSHARESEYYLSIERTRAGNIASFSRVGGIDVEARAHQMRHAPLLPTSSTAIADQLGIPKTVLDRLGEAFDNNYFSFLEINPFVIAGDTVELLDSAVEVDDEAVQLVADRWTRTDIRDPESKTPEELAIDELASQSQASFRLKVLTAEGSVFLLLSGGGVSIVVADAVAAAGMGAYLANYGEYSGNPNSEETYLYTKQVIKLMLRSPEPRKVLIISGGVANFTDIRITFKGVIRALDEEADELKGQGVRVFVRRGGPHEVEGLTAMRTFLDQKGLLGQVAGPELTLTDIVPPALAALKDGS